MNGGYFITSENIEVTYFADGDYFGQISGDHCHDKYEITYLSSAAGSYIVEGSEHKSLRGSLVLICPTSYHKVTFDSGVSPIGYTIYFKKNALTSAVASMLERITDNGGNGLFFSQVILSEAIVSCFERFAVARTFSESESSEYIRAILNEIVILLSATEGERIAHTNDELGARVAQYLNGNIEKNISLDRLARRFFVSKYHLCRAFKSYTGTSPHAYINHKRIIYAKGLIESGLTAVSAAERVGFGDYSAFYRAYVKVIGKSPTAE